MPWSNTSEHEIQNREDWPCAPGRRRRVVLSHTYKWSQVVEPGLLGVEGWLVLWPAVSWMLSFVTRQRSKKKETMEQVRPNRSFNSKRVRPHLYEEELSQVKGSLSCTSCPRRGNFSYISSQNLMNCLNEKQKVGLARKVTCLAGSPSFDDRVNLLAMPTFLHITTLACPVGSTWSR